MPDMLVKLYELPKLEPLLNSMVKQNLALRLGIPPEKHLVVNWISQNFSEKWASEADVAFANKPSTIYLAVDNDTNKLAGFACYEATYKGFFGPVGVHPDYRGKGIGRALLVASLHGLWNLGYAYAIIGGAGPVDFYQKAVGAIEIPHSSPGIYAGLLR